MTVNQISIFLENKYGKLSEILALLAEENIRIIAATVVGGSERCLPGSLYFAIIENDFGCGIAV